MIATSGINHGIGSGLMRATHKVLVLLFHTLLLLHLDLAAQTNEIRALWVDAFHPGFKSAVEVRQLLQDARAAHFNTLLVQVRKRGDAYYQSHVEPQASDLSPGFDPLAEIISQAHSGVPRMDVHAWMILYPVWNSSKIKPTQPNHPFLKHPEWLTRTREGNTSNEGSHLFDPGHPGVQRHLFDVAMDLVSHYQIDGLHLDHIRYPGVEWGYNPVSVKRFNQQYDRTGLPATNDVRWLQFRRNQVTALVRKIYLSSIALKPKLKLSAATFTGLPSIEKNEEWPQSRAFSSVLQDWRSWMEEGLLDINIPMSYFRQETNGNDIARWQNFIVNHRYSHHAVVGLGFYLNSPSNTLVQIQSVRLADASGNRPEGFGCYSYAAAGVNGDFKDLMTSLHQPANEKNNGTPILETDATIPAMPWKETPRRGHLRGFVMDASSHSGMDRATIALTGPLSKTLESDATGFFGSVDLPPGKYQIQATAWNRKPNPTMVSITPGTVATVNFILSPALHPTGSNKTGHPPRTKPKSSSKSR